MRNLLNILGITCTEFEKKTGVSVRKLWYSYTIKDIGFESLMKICNTFHIPISHFLSVEIDPEVVIDKSHYVIRQWSDIETDFTLMNQDINIGMRMGVREACAMLECSSKTYTKVFTKNDVSSIMTRDLLRLINKSGLFIGDYIKDSNRPIPLPEDMARRESVTMDNVMMCNKIIKKQEQTHRSLLTRMETMKQRICLLEAENKSLKQQLKAKGYIGLASEDTV